jgi:hypothetical protein
MPNATRVGLHLKPRLASGFEWRPLNSKFGVSICAAEGYAPTATLISGKEAGVEVERLGPTQRGILKLGRITPYKYQCMVAINPAFNEVATVQAPLIFEPKYEVALDLVVTAHREVVFEDYEWMVRLYLFE